MIHYHGTPIGGSLDEAQRFMPGRHCLVSYHHPHQLDSVVELCQSFCLDNGAFSFWRSGKGEVDFHGYHEWVHKLAGHPCLDFCLIPDKIDGTVEQNDELVSKWLRVGSEVESAPVYHLHEPLDYLEYLVANFRTVALGSSGQYSQPNTKDWWIRMAQVMETACDKIGRPKARLHGLRMLDPQVFSRLPLSSADSTNAAVNSGAISSYGSYVPPSRHMRTAVIADRVEQFNSSSKWQSFQQEQLF
ncbi:MAG: hypothetical protein ACPH7H_07100 [Porticoccaceae bacterium]